MRIALTGADGFLGWHVRWYALQCADIEIVSILKEDFEKSGQLAQRMRGVDVVAHLAGMNRGDDDELYETNVRLMRDVLAAIDTNGETPYIIFSSSMHMTRDTAYGRSKRAATDLLLAWSKRNDRPVAALVLTNIFGEGARAQYNSAVATFCNDLAQGNEPTNINAEAPLSLVYAQDVAAYIIRLAREPKGGELLVDGMTTTVGQIYALLKDYAALYRKDTVPVVHTHFEISLFNTLRSYFFEQGWYPRRLDARRDERGELFEAIRQMGPGQTFYSFTRPGVTRGNHYHSRKHERFLVVHGEADIRVRKLLSEETHTFHVTGDEPAFIDMPSFYTHNITNTGSSDLITLFWANELYDAHDADTYPHIV